MRRNLLNMHNFEKLKHLSKTIGIFSTFAFILIFSSHSINVICLLLQGQNDNSTMNVQKVFICFSYELSRFVLWPLSIITVSIIVSLLDNTKYRLIIINLATLIAFTLIILVDYRMHYLNLKFVFYLFILFFFNNLLIRRIRK